MSSQKTGEQLRARSDRGERDYYRLLGVPYGATEKQITSAYRAAMKDAHPDRQAPEARAEAEERAKLLNLAYRTLSKAETRRAYDQTLKASAVQDQVMGRYFGGMGMPGNPDHDPFASALKRERSRRERGEQREAHRSAVLTTVLVFAGAGFALVALLVLWAILAAATHFVF